MPELAPVQPEDAGWQEAKSAPSSHHLQPPETESPVQVAQSG